MHHASRTTIPRTLFLGVILVGPAGCGDHPASENRGRDEIALVGQEPVNSNASAKTREVLRLLNELPTRSENKVISGQVLHPLDWVPLEEGYVPEPGHLAAYPYPCDRVDDIHAQTGEWVGISSSEYTDWEQAYGTAGGQKIVSEALNPCFIQHSRRGGIVSPHFHPMNPKDGTYFPGTDPGSTGPVTADELLHSGPIHDNWMKILDAAAAGLRELRDNDVVVLWRPMHARDAGWWWGQSVMSRDDYRRIWAHMVDYFSNTWQLDNVLYVQSWYFIYYDSSTMDELYAGSENVDIVAVDHANEYVPPDLWKVEYQNLLSFGKPFGSSQVDCFGCDTRGIIQHIRDQWPSAVFFIGFDHTLYPTDGLGYGQNAQELLSDPWVANAGEIFGRESTCGNGVCDSDEGCGSCPTDCGSCPSPCGDGYCEGEAGEDCGSCETDCGGCSSPCGDGYCEGEAGEDCDSCSTDCGGCSSSLHCYYYDGEYYEVSCDSDCGCNSCWLLEGDNWSEVSCRSSSCSQC